MIYKIRQTVILVGGKGTRMRPLTLRTPKPMIPIFRKPFLEYIIENLKRNEITEVVLLVGYLHRQIEKYFKDGRKYGLEIRYSYSPIKAETGARLRKALPLLDDRVLLLYGDNYWPLQLRALEDFYYQKRARALVTVYSNIDHYTKNNMYVDEHGLVTKYDRTRKQKGLNGVDIGYFILNKTDLERLPKSNSSFEDTLVSALVAERQLVGYLTNHKYYGLSRPDRLDAMVKYFEPKKVCFLDRDGVINKRPPKATYITKWSEFVLLPRIKAALRKLQRYGFKLFLLTNQPGIARGLMTQDDLNEIHKRLMLELKKAGITIEQIYVCAHGWNDNCFCRKPKPGLLFQAAAGYHINLFESYYIGDDERDVIAGKRAGCRTVYISQEVYKNKDQPDIIAKSLYSAVEKLVQETL